MRIAVGSANQIKIDAVSEAANQVFQGQDIEVISVKSASGVPDQPIGLEQTLEGAKNRARFALQNTEADLATGLEGGVFNLGGRLIDIGIVYILGHTTAAGLGISQGIALPAEIAEVVTSGSELGVALDELYQSGTIHSRDCTGFLTQGELPSLEYYRQPAILAIKDYLQQIESI